jgi:glycosyltransferase involved in cell wall biosynthesis
MVWNLNRLKINFFERYGEGGLRIKNKKYKNPLFSIITVVYNGEKYLEKTIESVIKQKFKNFEYIVIDGGSTDNSVKIIEKFEKKIDYWVSEKDRGIYDAFNKGMRVSKGKFIGFINSDDIYKKNALKIISNYIEKNQQADFIFGSVKKHWGVLYGYKPHKIKYSWGFYSSHSTGFFIKRKVAEKVGFYNIKYKYHADYDYFYRLIVKNKMKGISTKKNEIVGVFRRGGFSSKISFWKKLKEDIRIRYDNGQNIFLLILIFSNKFLRNIDQILKNIINK